jgi:hypothetical protein
VKQQKHTGLIEGVHFHFISTDVPKKVQLIEKNEIQYVNKLPIIQHENILKI